MFAGAQTNMARIGVEHPISRIWSLSADLGFSQNERLQSIVGPANDAQKYIDGYAGLALHRYFGRTLHGFASYQFSELSFDHSYCTTSSPCSRISNRQIVTFGLDWTPRPIRID